MLKTVHEREDSASSCAIVPVILLSVLFLLLLAGACIAQNCRIGPVSGITFPGYNPLSSDVTRGDGSFTVTCTVSAQGRVWLSAGHSGDISQRLLKGSGGEDLPYNLYSDASCTTIWGDGGQGTYFGVFVFGEGGGSKQFPVYGKILPKQNVAAQGFEDRLTITVEW